MHVGTAQIAVRDVITVVALIQIPWICHGQFHIFEEDVQVATDVSKTKVILKNSKLS